MSSALPRDPATLPAAERNLARALFGTGPANAALRPVHSERGPDAFAASIVADLKDAAPRYPADARLDSLVQELRSTSGAFAHLWPTATATPHSSEQKTVEHPEAGDILLDCDVLVVPGAELRMVTYTAAAGSSDAGKLDVLRVTGGRDRRASAVSTTS